MEVDLADFSGYASKNNLKCADGRTIRPDAFKHHDGQRVPLVWQHQHDDSRNVLGHALLENRKEGVYVYGFFNDTDAGQNAKTLVKHGDITALSIYANQLREQNKNVVHGQLREVSLVLAGANPGAFIDTLSLRHGDGTEEVLEDEAIIYSDSEIEFGFDGEDENLEHDATSTNSTDTKEGAPVAETAEKTVKDVFDTFTDEQKNVVYFMIGEALESAGDENGGELEQSAIDEITETIKASVTNEIAELTHSFNGFKEGFTMSNVFDQNDKGEAKGATLTHSQTKTILEDAFKTGSLKESILAHAQEYGVEDIDILFPDAKAVANSPEIVGRRTEWVADVIAKTKHSPFSRIKSTAVDLTADEARAKGYVKGNLKKDEIIKLLKRVTTPTTIYKKQKLDRDDIVDITDLDVVAWLKAEMRVMLDEELAGSVLIGDGRESDDEDKIDEDHVRPIADDADMYAHQITVASNLDPKAIIPSVLRARTYYKGTGTPTFYTTDAILTELILIEDKMGRRLYETEAALAAALRVDKIVTVEIMDRRPDVVGIIVNLADYTLGADRGGAISMFDDFDIDYNQYKYLIETRVSGALTKPKSAIVIKRTVGTVVSPGSPSYNGTTHVITIPSIAGVVYSIDGETVSGNVTIEETTDVEARPASGYSFPPNTNRDWTYVYTA